MSRFMSQFESIEKLQFHPVPSRPIAIVKAVRHGSATAMLAADGLIYTDVVDKCVCYSNTVGRHADLFRCCKKLGVLSPKVIQHHIDTEAQRELLAHRQWRANQIEDAAKAIGLRLTKAQAAVIKAAREA